MKEQDNATYDFKLLPEEAIEKDLFEDKTHEQLADTLSNLIQRHEGKGQTIGLEGAWGSGKSTVVAILKKKLIEAGCRYFYFDAWAHEGDPLRRIFLESLVDQLGDGNSELDSLKQELSNRKRKIDTTTKRFATPFGRCMALAFLFVPLGAGMVSAIDYSGVTLRWGLSVHWTFLVGAFLSLMPVWVVGCRVVALLWRAQRGWKTVFRLKNWALLESNSDTEQTQEISEEDERSSIEFEHYFHRIMSAIVSRDSQKKLVMVIDNLDRVRADDSLRIWATLQTFLQSRNPSNKGAEWFDRIWIVVPYDPEGLAELWKADDKRSGFAHDFFDKCFQLRLEVPRPVLTGWEHFAAEMIERGLVGWPKAEKQDALDILQRSRTALAEVPTPRKVKTYINQVGVLRQHVDQGIPTRSVCYYVILRYIRDGGLTVDTIRAQLEKAEQPAEKDRHYLPRSCPKDLAGLVFGVPSAKGQQLLLRPDIERALQGGEGTALGDMREDHGDGFWSVFNYHISTVPLDDMTLSYSKAVRLGLWDDSKARCASFVRKASDIKLAFPDAKQIEEYEAHLALLADSEVAAKRAWRQIIAGLRPDFESESALDAVGRVDLLSRCVAALNESAVECITLPCKRVENWMEWAKAAADKDIPAHQWLVPHKSARQELAKLVLPGALIDERIPSTLRYCLSAGISGWKTFVEACDAHIKHGNGTARPNTHSASVLEMLLEIAFHDTTSSAQLKELVASGQFHNFVFTVHNQGEPVLVGAATLFAYCHSDEIHALEIPGVGNAANGIQAVREFWTARSAENAKAVWELLVAHGQASLLWALAEDEKNKLMSDVILLALKSECAPFFGGPNALDRLSLAVGWTEKRKQDRELTDRFLRYAELEKELAESEKLDLVTSCYELNLLVDKVSDERVLRSFADGLGQLDMPAWSQALQDDTDLPPLAIAVRKRQSAFALANPLLEAVVQFATKWATGAHSPSDAQREYWPSLIDLLGESFRKRFGERATLVVAEADMLVSQDFFTSNREFLDLRRLVNDERRNIQTVVERSITNKDFEHLQVLDAILQSDSDGSFTPDKHIPDVLHTPLNDLYWAEEDSERRSLLERVARCFSVELKQPTPPEAEDESDADPAAGKSQDESSGESEEQ